MESFVARKIQESGNRNTNEQDNMDAADRLAEVLV
jgi:hypothetical protein